jgi:DNA polymerase delta subunit 1
MPEAIIPPQKRVLGDAANTSNGILKSPSGLKKRKLDNEPSVQFTPSSQISRRKVGSSQPQKSQFEEEVLEKLTQDIGDLKENNSEKDQQWERPPLGDFDPAQQNICFQQIDAEEATLMGKPAIRLFGVTEVNIFAILWCFISNKIHRLDNLYAFMSLALNITSTSPLLSASPKRIATLTNISWSKS